METETLLTPAPAKLPTGKLFINNQWLDAADGRTAPTINPATEAPIQEIAQGTAEDVNRAVRAARRAFDSGPWATMNVYDRGKLLIKIGELVEKYGDELAYLESVDMGTPITFSRQFNIPQAVAVFHFYGGLATKIYGRTSSSLSNTLNYTLREPLGVIGAITPFNFPLLLSLTKIGPALAAGNTIVHKPASGTPLTALRMAEIMAEAGLPEGVYNVVTGPGSELGDALVKHPDVNKISFTGSTSVGQGIIRASADTVKKVTMELGGKSANIVFADADLPAAINQAFYGIFFNKGEICTAGSRLLVERRIHDEVVAGLKQQISQTVMGNPLDPAVQFGPLASKDQFEKVSGYVRTGQEEDGATLYTGGHGFHPEGSNGKGYYFEPTIFTRATNQMRIAQEEIFGPVLTVIPFDTDQEAIDLANGTPYGLASGVQTTNLKRAHYVASKMKAGTVWVNTYNLFDPGIPFGGHKMSGYGRENGPETLESYTQHKAVWVNLD